jgi:hypothetical protein
LKRVLGIRNLVKYVLANVEHNSAMAPHQEGERGVITSLDKTADQFGVGKVRGHPSPKHGSQLPNHGIELSARHENSLAREKAAVRCFPR